VSAPRVSVLIPCYNREAHIRQCVTSVTSQSFRDLEIVICDNASTDRTYEILEELASQDSRIHLLRNETNLGPIPNWLRCLEKATGDFTHWMWSDDYVEPGFYEAMAKRLECMGASICIASHKVFREQKNEFVEGRYFQEFDIIAGTEVAQKMLARISLLTWSPAAWLLPTEAVRRNFYNQIPIYAGYDCNQTAIGADLLMIVGCALSATRVVRCREACVIFRAHAGSISISRPTWRHYEAAKIWFILLKRLDKGLSHRVWLLLRAARIRSPRLVWQIVTRQRVAEGKSVARPLVP